MTEPDTGWKRASALCVMGLKVFSVMSVRGYDALGPAQRSLAVDRLRNGVIDRPRTTLVLAVSVAALVGVFLRRFG